MRWQIPWTIRIVRCPIAFPRGLSAIRVHAIENETLSHWRRLRLGTAFRGDHESTGVVGTGAYFAVRRDERGKERVVKAAATHIKLRQGSSGSEVLSYLLIRLILFYFHNVPAIWTPPKRRQNRDLDYVMTISSRIINVENRQEKQPTRFLMQGVEKCGEVFVDRVFYTWAGAMIKYEHTVPSFSDSNVPVKPTNIEEAL